jgi:hypothetical protein
MVWVAQHLDFVMHAEVVDNLIEVDFFFVPVVKRDRDALRSEASSSSNPAQICFGVAVSFVTYSKNRNVIVDYDFDLWHVEIDASREQICSY